VADDRWGALEGARVVGDRCCDRDGVRTADERFGALLEGDLAAGERCCDREGVLTADERFGVRLEGVLAAGERCCDREGVLTADGRLGALLDGLAVPVLLLLVGVRTEGLTALPVVPLRGLAWVTREVAPRVRTWSVGRRAELG
jgi:hypothetical protein